MLSMLASSVGRTRRNAVGLANHLQILESLSPSELFQDAIEILKKTERTSFEIKLVMKATERIPFFEKIIEESGREAHEQCCEHMTLLTFQANEAVFEIGSVGKDFFIILSGSVSVLVNLPETIEDENGKTIVRMVMKEINILRAGASFGELALLREKPRTATVRCRENSCFAVLTKDKYKEILAKDELRSIQNKIEFFSNVAFFSRLSKGTISILLYYFKEMKYTIKDVLYDIDDPAEDIYIIKNGEFRLSVELSVEDKISEASDLIHVEQKKAPKKRRLDVAVLGKAQIFGEEEVILDCRRRMQARCTSSDGVVYVLNKKVDKVPK
eukprot:TRINITY_DN5126_c0_g1_i5.p1 TRINITY_DN5126_c0_g1~~TRINITY_DN5126_c0_g1_i5.p1  ORF type:complete len:328 (-),score=70.22 TRINITY_DN5126_c0_g1_i5:756-1739(-)